MRYFISAGEASGDLHASQLIRALRERDKNARFTFLGGDMMAAESGTAPLTHYRDMAYMGFTQVILHSRELLAILRKARRALRDTRPDALILVDYPSFNLKLAAEAHRLGIPVYYYISPKVWAWKEGRVRRMRRYVRRILSILPFETEYYRRRHNLDITYVGNPSVEEVDERISRIKADDPDGSLFISRHGLERRPILALVPGSRRSEILRNLPVMLGAAAQFEGMQPVIAAAPGIGPEIYRQIADGVPVIAGATFELVFRATGAFVTSGTATLEAALTATPQAVCYRANGSRLTYNIMKRILRVRHVSLPNLITDADTVPEMLLHNCTPDAVAAALRNVLPGAPGYPVQQRGYDTMRRRLGTGHAAVNAATYIINDLKSLRKQ